MEKTPAKMKQDKRAWYTGEKEKNKRIDRDETQGRKGVDKEQGRGRCSRRTMAQG
jgi:hypothetical protein